MKLLLGLAVLVATLDVLRCDAEDQPKGISEDTLRRELVQRNPYLGLLWSRYIYCKFSVTQLMLSFSKCSSDTSPIFFLLVPLRAVHGRGETCGWGGEESSVWGQTDEGGDVEERAEARTPHEVTSTQQWQEECENKRANLSAKQKNMLSVNISTTRGQPSWLRRWWRSLGKQRSSVETPCSLSGRSADPA